MLAYHRKIALFLMCWKNRIFGTQREMGVSRCGCSNDKGGSMDFNQFTMPLLGGVLIGISTSLLLLLKGRIFGVSGILAGVLIPKKGDRPGGRACWSDC